MLNIVTRFICPELLEKELQTKKERNHENIFSDASIDLGFGASKVFKKLPIIQAQERRNFGKKVGFF